MRKRPTDLIDRIADDLRSKKLRFPASEAILLRDYERGGQLPWREYRIAACIVGEADGTLVFVDDYNEQVVGEMDFDGEYGDHFGNGFCTDVVRPYVEKIAGSTRAEWIRFTLYRLPRGSYASMDHAFFAEHGDYIGETRVRVAAQPVSS